MFGATAKAICEPGEQKDETDNMDGDEPKRSHGGCQCGTAQPQIQKEGLKLRVRYERSNDDDGEFEEITICSSCAIEPLSERE